MSWSKLSERNVILGFRVPTTIGLRKLPAGSPCSQLAPLAPRASLGPWSKLGVSRSESNVILGPWVTGTFLEPQEAPSLLPLLPACSSCSLRIPVSLEPLGVKGLWARWEQAEAGSPPSQLTPLTPAHSSSVQPPSLLQLAPTSLQPPSSLPALSSLLQLAPSSLEPPSSLPTLSLLQLAPNSKLAPARTQLTPARSQLSAHSQLTPACSQWPCMCWGPHHLWGVRGYGAR